MKSVAGLIRLCSSAQSGSSILNIPSSQLATASLMLLSQPARFGWTGSAAASASSKKARLIIWLFWFFSWEPRFYGVWNLSSAGGTLRNSGDPELENSFDYQVRYYLLQHLRGFMMLSRSEGARSVIEFYTSQKKLGFLISGALPIQYWNVNRKKKFQHE